MKKSNVTLGIILIFIGIVSILHKLNYWGLFHFKITFGLILLFIGLIFELRYFTGRSDAGNLVPGGICITLGIFYIIKPYFNFYFSWQIFALAVAVGLYELYYFGNKDNGTLIAASGLTIISIGSIVLNTFNTVIPAWLNSGLILSIILVLAGTYIIYKSFK
ncbi:hypothetical protein ACJDT4_13755 [Clostridium neuense]|uniref:DUF5668 domain-containing protein n=1 Tax=Clostridium neuense TaxID=1728934 RepID=A0ABW8TG50_9CLOT